MANFGAFAVTAGTRTIIPQVPTSSILGVILGNESPYHTTVTLEGTGLSRTLYPGTVDKFYIEKGFNGNILLDPVALLNNTASWPSEFIQADIFGPNNEPEGVFPYTLVRTTNQGSNVAATAIDNEGNPPNTQIITAIVAGDSPNKAVSMTNDGIFSIGTAAHPGLISFDNGLILSNGAGGWTVVLLKTNTIDAPADGGNSVLSVTAGVTRIQSTGVIRMQVPGGTTTWEFDNTGSLSCIGGGGINYNIGRIKDINHGSVSTAGTVTVNHGLSGTPNGVWVECTGPGTTTHNVTNLTPTQFTLFNASGVNQGFNWLAYR